jgi:dolichol-phosphate mannosyltransferase
MQTIVGLPCYNEQDNISELIDRILQFNPDVTLFFVDDGSTDNSAAIIEEYTQKFANIYLIRHTKNMGLGKAMNTILNHVAENYDDDDILVTFDSDNTHPPNIISAMINKLKAQNLDIVIASRYVRGGQELGLSAVRKLYSRGARFFCSVVFHIKNVRDYSCGYRAYRVRLLKKLKSMYDSQIVENAGFECMLEIIQKCRHAKIDEYPLILNYSLKKGDSKMRPFKTIMGYFRIAFKCRVEKL